MRSSIDGWLSKTWSRRRGDTGRLHQTLVTVREDIPGGALLIFDEVHALRNNSIGTGARSKRGDWAPSLW